MIGLAIGTSVLVARAHGAGDTARVHHLVRQSTMLTIGLGIATALIGTFAARPILAAMGATGAALDRGTEFLVTLFAGATFTYLALVYTAVLRGLGNTRLPFFATLASTVVNVVVNYGLILGHLGLPALGVRGAALGTVIAHFFNLVVLLYFLRPFPRPTKIDWTIARVLLRIGGPVALDMLILNATFLSIVGMLGHIDEVSVAANGIGMRIQSLAFMPVFGISLATGAMVGHSLGAGNVDRARQVARASVVLCTIASAIPALPMIAFGAQLVSVFDVAANTPLESYAVTWLVVLGIELLIGGAQIALKGTLQGAGATLPCLVINAVATFAIQIPIAAVLAFGFGLGALGVWVSFPLSFAVQAMLLAIVYRRGRWAIVGK
jgi:putative MATE family efflux protein